MKQVKKLTSDNNIFHCHEQIAELYDSAILYWLKKCEECIHDKGLFTIALSGGNTPILFYRALASGQFDYKIPWDKIHVFFSDERAVPIEHSDSNYKMVNNELLKHTSIPSENIHPMYPCEGDLYEASNKYSLEIDRIVEKDSNGMPIFDLMMLGIGTDGHTASLFSTESIKDGHWVYPVYVKKLKSWRITLTFSIINNSHDIMFLVIGKDKSPIVAEIYFNPARAVLPVSQITAIHEIHWFIDYDAGSLIFN